MLSHLLWHYMKVFTWIRLHSSTPMLASVSDDCSLVVLNSELQQV